jgi:hypothetical protein
MNEGVSALKKGPSRAISPTLLQGLKCLHGQGQSSTLQLHLVNSGGGGGGGGT